MSKTETAPLTLREAREIAGPIAETLGAWCERVQTAGSVRRECERVNDLEFVCLPRPMFMAELMQAMRQGALGRVVKGGYPGRYAQIRTREMVKLDLFFATRETWAVNLTIRTGCAEFSHALMRRWKRISGGGRCEGARLRWRDGSPADTREEGEVFQLLGLSWWPPKERTPAAAERIGRMR